MKVNVMNYGNGFVIVFCMIIAAAYCLGSLEDVQNIHDLCRVLAFNKHIFDVNDKDSFQLNLNSTAGIHSEKALLQKLKKKCTLTLKACSSCHITVTIRNMFIPSCSDKCSCNYFGITESLSDYYTKVYCGDYSNRTLYFESKTKILSVDFVQSVHKIFYVALSFNISRNSYIFTGTPGSVIHENYIESPNFPRGYPSDYGAEYIFQALGQGSFVQLLFLDFQLSQWSFIEITGHNGSHTESFNGIQFRPPAVNSQGSMLKLKFQANDQPSSYGFRAIYTFANRDSELLKPYTGCGGFEQNYGGTIDIVVRKSSVQLYDCIWLIRPPIFFHQVFLSAAILKSAHLGPQSYLEFREGLTSKSNVSKSFHCNKHLQFCNSFPVDEVNVPATSGLYIRFRGYLTNESSIVIPYSFYNEKNCTADEFSCRNERCIKSFLQCDGYNHCLDNSDEAKCGGYIDRTKYWYSTEPARKIIPPFTGAAGFIIFTALGMCGLLVVLFVVAVYVFGWYKARLTGPADESLHTPVSENTVHRFPDIPLMSSDIDMPPAYEHVIRYNERYPPLFYTKSKHHPLTETNCSQAAFCVSSSKIDVNEESDLSIEIFSNVCASGIKDESFDNDDAKKCRESIFLKAVASMNFYQPLFRSASEVHNKTTSFCSYVDQCVSVVETIYSKSLPSSFQFSSPESENVFPNCEDSVFYDCPEHAVGQPLIRRYSYSFVSSFSEVHSRLIPSLKTKILNHRLSFHHPFRPKTFSF